MMPSVIYSDHLWERACFNINTNEVQNIAMMTSVMYIDHLWQGACFNINTNKVQNIAMMTSVIYIDHLWQHTCFNTNKAQSIAISGVGEGTSMEVPAVGKERGKRKQGQVGQ